MSFFSTTHWSVVLEAAHGQTEHSRQALEELCRTYWKPIYAVACYEGVDPHDAEDLTQSFFAHLIEHELVAKADAAQGFFRSYLLRCFKNFRLNQVARRQARKRGGDFRFVSLDEFRSDERLAYELTQQSTPDTIFDRTWAMITFDQAHSRLERKYVEANRQELFAQLRPFLQGRDRSTGYAQIASVMNTTEAAIKMEVSRMRQRFRESLREVVAQTVADPQEVQNELHYLVRVLSQ